MLKRPHALALAASLSLLAALPAQAHLETWTGTFAPEGAGGRTGSGTLSVEYDDFTNIMKLTATFAGLSGTTRVAHIHCCAGPFPATAGVAFAGSSAPGFGATLTGFASGVTAGSYSQTFDMGVISNYGASFLAANGGTANGARDALLAAFNSGTAYFNIHTTTFTGGEIRAQIAPVPEPGTYALMALGLLGIGAVKRRQSKTMS